MSLDAFFFVLKATAANNNISISNRRPLKVIIKTGTHTRRTFMGPSTAGKLNGSAGIDFLPGVDDVGGSEVINGKMFFCDVVKTGTIMMMIGNCWVLCA